MRRSYGFAAGRRFTLAMVSALGAQQLVVGLALQRGRRPTSGSGPRALDLVDALTLSRGGAAAVLLGLLASGVRDRRGPAGWLGWGALLPCVTLTDWVDGPLARRRGPTELGRVLDLEADSWLTLCASVAGVAWGGLPRYYLAETWS